MGFDNSRIVGVTRYNEAGPRPAGMVMTVEVELDGQRFVGINGGPEFTFDEAVSFPITCDTQDEIEPLLAAAVRRRRGRPVRLAEGPLRVSWQVVPTGVDEVLDDSDPERARRAMAAMLGMRKIDLAVLQRAADGLPTT
ncbi:MAG TPA: VOC family protein [Egibacteraceae bacterium]|nr:VOC family protein [Egibacteraceae bacterium]